VIGYNPAAHVAHEAHKKGTTLREEALAQGVSAEQFDAVVDPKKMLGPNGAAPAAPPALIAVWDDAEAGREHEFEDAIISE